MERGKIRLPITLVVTILFVAGVLLFPSLRPRRVDVCLTECDTDYIYRVGDYLVELEAVTEVEGDNGPANLLVFIDDQLVTILEGSFSYDTLTDLPIAFTSLRWLDGDLQRDLVIDLNGPNGSELYYIGSENGQLLPLAQ